MSENQLLYTAAHAGFAAEGAPLGGGGAVADELIRQWTRTQPFPLQVLSPTHATGHAITRFSERQYARFCHTFGDTCTTRILQHDPAHTRVLVNDISEAPNFARLQQAGFRITTIYHVDVVAYVSRIYLRNALPPAALTRLYRWFGPLYPSMARLVFEKQSQSLQYSRLVVVPSASMRDLLLACYPDTPPERIRVLPWGQWLPDFQNEAIAAEAARLRAVWQLDPAKPTLLTLSRISPEKGQDLLLEALQQNEPNWQLILAGEAAYMMGAQFKAKLLALAKQLKRTQVILPGHLTGLQKRAAYSLAGLYVFPSRHESYGLTLLEALACGLPAVCLDHHGARAVMQPAFGRVVPPHQLRQAIDEMMANPELRRQAGRAAQAWASQQRFAETAARLASWIAET